MSQTAALYEAKFVIFNEYIVSPLKYVTHFCFIPAFLSSFVPVYFAKAIRKVMNFQSYISALVNYLCCKFFRFFVRCQMFWRFSVWVFFYYYYLTVPFPVLGCKYSAQKGGTDSTASSRVCRGQLCCKVSHTPVLNLEQSEPILIFSVWNIF